MERGYIKIKENEANQLIVEAKIVNGTLWMTKHEIADLLNVFVSSISNNFRAIFKSGLLQEENVTQIHKYENNGRQCEMTLYNLDAIIHVAFRTASFEGKVLREWVAKSFTEYLKMEKLQSPDALIVFSNNSNTPFIASLN